VKSSLTSFFLDNPGQIRYRRPRRGGVITVAGGIAVFAQEREDQVVVLLREPALFVRQG